MGLGVGIGIEIYIGDWIGDLDWRVEIGMTLNDLSSSFDTPLYNECLTFKLPQITILLQVTVFLDGQVWKTRFL